MNLAIKVDDLKKSYKKTEVLKDVSFEVREGQIFSLLGSNGAGKTTTIRILATLIKPDSGTVIVFGSDAIRQAEKVRESISLTGQYAAVDENLTGRENLHLIGKLRYLSDRKEIATSLLERFELTKAADRRVKTYSGGMRRKLDLAMSLMGSPKIIFLDEPTTGLDPQSRIALWGIIKGLKEKGMTIFLTTQYLDEAEHLADYVAILDGGKIVAGGTVEEMKKLNPTRIIEFGFETEELLSQAASLLDGFSQSKNIEERILSVTTDDGIGALSEMLKILNENNISVTKLEKKSPTLEDIFLKLIKEDNKKEEANNE